MSPHGHCRVHHAGALTLLAAAGILASSPSRAERLPLAHYTSEDGLPSDSVSCALEDSRGFLWFGTSDGLSRFDGHAFRNFTVEDERGLAILFLVEDRDGSLIAGTFGSVYRFDPAGGGAFEKILSIPQEHLGICLLRDRAGTIWAGGNGLYRLESGGGGPAFRRVLDSPSEVRDLVMALAQDGQGNLWIGAHGLYGLSPEGRGLRAATSPAFQGGVPRLAVDEEGRVWALSAEGICRIEAIPGSSGDPAFECRQVPLGGWSPMEGSRLISRAGSGVWMGSREGIKEIDGDGRVVRTISRTEGLSKSWANPLLVDSGGHVWLTLVHDGVARLNLSGFTSYGAAEGLEQITVSTIQKASTGEIVVAGGDHTLYVLDAGRFTAVRPNLPDIAHPGWGWYQFDLQDHEGDWWIPTDQGIYRFAAVKRLSDLERTPPRSFYGIAEGLPSESVFRLFEDSRGDIWVSVLHPPWSDPAARPTVCRWERATRRFHAYGAADGIIAGGAPSAFIELPDGSLWIGFGEDGEIYRRRDGAFERLAGPDGAFTRGLVSAMHHDSMGRLWIATRGAGVCRVDEPMADRPSCNRFTLREGLASDVLNGIAEDAAGRIYLGGSRGVDVLEGENSIRHLGRSDGLPRSYVTIVYGDPEGGIWFGTTNGLARLDARATRKAPDAPRVRIDGIQVAGLARPLSAIGESSVTDLVLSPAERRLQIDYIAVTGDVGDLVEFQHRLHPSEPWSEATPERTLLLPNLGPGRYQFEVRAIGTAGASLEPASVSFSVLAPLWMRPWFLGLVMASLATAAFGAYRLRVAHLLALQRLQMRIAGDLHDEVGSGLGSIGVLADLAAEAGLEEDRRRDLLDQIAASASELGGSMGDIVWSLRSGRTSIESLARHLSERARRLFPEGPIAFRTRFPAEWPEVDLSLAVRHGVTMIGLEAMHNAARHSGATVVTLDLAPEGGRWRLSVADDGVGVEEARSKGGDHDRADAGGLGLAGMRRRAESIGAELRVESQAGRGTMVTVVFDPDAGVKARPG